MFKLTICDDHNIFIYFIDNKIVITFLESRKKNLNLDNFSIILYASDAQKICERVSLGSENIAEFMKRNCFTKQRQRGTCFGEAIYQAEMIMQKYPTDHFIVMFLTDGEGRDGYARNNRELIASKRVAKLFNHYKKFSLYAIHFGGGNHSQALVNIAREGGDKGITSASIPEHLGDFFISTVAAEADVALLTMN